MTVYRHLLELRIMLLVLLRSSCYVGIPYSLRSIGVRVLSLVLCPSGILGKGTLRAYPWGRIPTHPFRVLGFCARGNTKGELFSCRYQDRTA